MLVNVSSFHFIPQVKWERQRKLLAEFLKSQLNIRLPGTDLNQVTQDVT